MIIGDGSRIPVNPKTDAQLREALHGAQRMSDDLETRVTAIEADYVSADNAFGTDDRVIISDGTDRKVEASSVAISNVVTAGAAFVNNEYIIVADGTGKAVKVGTLPAAQLLFSGVALADNDILIGSGGRGVDASGVNIGNVVTSVSEFGTDDRVIVSNGTNRGVESSSIPAANVVTGGSDFGADKIIIGIGTGRQVAASGLDVDDINILLTTALYDPNEAYSASGLLVQTASNSDLQTAETAIAADDVVTADTAFGTTGLLIVSDGTGKGVEASAIPAADVVVDSDIANMVTAASAFGTDNSVLRADSTGRGSQSSSLTITDLPQLSFGGVSVPILIGEDAGTGATFGSSTLITGIGINAFLNATAVGTDVFAVGANAGRESSLGNEVVCFGPGAGRSSTVGAQSFCMGSAAGRSSTVGTAGVFIGNQAAFTATVGNNCIAMGTSALGSGVSCGNGNVAIGLNAGLGLTGGSGAANTFLGQNAGNNASQGANVANSTAIGNGAFTTASNQVVIGNTSVTSTVLRGRLTIDLFTDATRGAAGTAGRIIFNSTDANLNIDDGTNWILPDGTVT